MAGVLHNNHDIVAINKYLPLSIIIISRSPRCATNAKLDILEHWKADRPRLQTRNQLEKSPELNAAVGVDQYCSAKAKKWYLLTVKKANTACKAKTQYLLTVK